MNVANHALAGGDGASESVFDGMARFRFGNGGIARSAEAGVAELRVRAGVRGVAIVGVNHVAGRAAAGAIVAGMIVRAGKRHHRIEEAGLLQAEEDGIGAKLGAEATVAELVVGLAGIFIQAGIANFTFLRRRARIREERLPGCEISHR